MGVLRKFLVVALGVIFTIARPTDSAAYTRIVKKGETLAGIALQVYGDAKLERVLVGANALDAAGGSAISPGMRLEIPTLGYGRTALGDMWPALAERLMGDRKYAPVLAEANGTHSWMLPDIGMEFVVPYVLRHYCPKDETVFDVAERYLGDKMKAWQLVVVNDLKGNDVKRGDVLLVPLIQLTLTPVGQAEALTERGRMEFGGKSRERQKRIEEALPELAAHVRTGRYVEAVGLGSRLLGMGDATKSQLARIGKSLATAYVALDALGAAMDACRLYLENAHVVHLESDTTSPKVRDACAATK